MSAATTPPTGPSRWGDLAPRVISGVAMIAVGAVAIWVGGGVFAALAVAQPLPTSGLRGLGPLESQLALRKVGMVV